MTQKKDSTKKLKSISTGNLCSVAQYVAEKVCLRKAEKDNKGSLEYKFWSKSKNEQYEIQVRAASKLIKKHGEDALLKYINSPSGRNVYSLGFLHKSGRYVLIIKFVEKGVANAAKLVEKCGGEVAGFIFLINLFDLGGKKTLEKKGYKTFSLIDFPGH